MEPKIVCKFSLANLKEDCDFSDDEWKTFSCQVCILNEPNSTK